MLDKAPTAKTVFMPHISVKRNSTRALKTNHPIAGVAPPPHRLERPGVKS